MSEIYNTGANGEVLLSLLGDLVQGLFFVAAARLKSLTDLDI